MIPRTRNLAVVLLCTGLLLASCGSDTVAGKTTTTSNGGGVVAIGPDGHPLAGCIALAARSWDPIRGAPGEVDTLVADSAGRVELPVASYAFLDLRDRSGRLGSWTKRIHVMAGDERTVPLDTLRTIRGTWADRARIGTGRLFLDSSFGSASLNDDGTFLFERVPVGDYAILLDSDSKTPLPMGAVRLAASDIQYEGSGNILVDGDTTGSPLWIDDFESVSHFPLLRPSVPGVSPWYVWSSGATLILPASSMGDSILRAIGPDSSRAGRAYHSRFTSSDPYSWVALGITSMEIDIAARGQLCFSYRTDTLLKIQLQRDSVDSVRPALWTTVPSSMQWRDACVATSDFVANSENPDSLATWSTFAKRVLVIEFQTPAGGTFLDLDDIRLR